MFTILTGDRPIIHTYTPASKRLATEREINATLWTQWLVKDLCFFTFHFDTEVNKRLI